MDEVCVGLGEIQWHVRTFSRSFISPGVLFRYVFFAIVFVLRRPQILNIVCDLRRPQIFIYRKKQIGPDRISWNFEKFLIGKDGKVLKRFSPRTNPDSPEVIKAIESALK